MMKGSNARSDDSICLKTWCEKSRQGKLTGVRVDVSKGLGWERSCKEFPTVSKML